MTDDQSRQTLSFLQRRFREAGIRPHTKRGQNFLIDLNLLRVLFESAAVDRDDVVLEVGTGTGSLTALLAQSAAAVVTVEIDPAMFQLAAEELHRLAQRRHAPSRRLAGQEPAQPGRHRGGPRAIGRGARPALEAGRQPALPRRHAGAGQPVGRRRAAANHDRHDPKGTGRAHHRPAGQQGLRRAERLGSSPSPRGNPPHAAAGSLLAAAEILVRLPPSHAGRGPAAGASPTASSFTISSAPCSCTAASSSARSCSPS